MIAVGALASRGDTRWPAEASGFAGPDSRAPGAVYALAAGAIALLFTGQAFAHQVLAGDQALVRETSGFAPGVYAWLGAKHMVTGVDHLLYLVAILFFVQRIRDVVAYVSCFAVGHSITLIAGVLGAWSVNPLLVDAAIGLSITYKALENLETFPAIWRTYVPPPLAVFGFGLLHGTGLATRMLELRPSQDGLLGNLISFNVGVELGQAAALLAIVPIVMLWRGRAAFAAHARVVNTVLALVGVGFCVLHLHAWNEDRGARAAASVASTQAPSDSKSAVAGATAGRSGLAASLARAPNGIPIATAPNAVDLAAPRAEHTPPDTRLAPPGSHLASDRDWSVVTRTITLAVEGDREVKAWVGAGEPVLYRWSADGEVYFDAHGDPDPSPGPAPWPQNYAQRYAEGEARAGRGAMLPRFSGRHGFYFMNLETRPVKITIEYAGFGLVAGEPDELHPPPSK